MTKTTVQITSRSEAVDTRMAPDGVVRTLTNLRMRRAGGIESVPGWSATAIDADAGRNSVTIPVAHGEECLLYGRDLSGTTGDGRGGPYLVDTNGVVLGPVPERSAARRYAIGTGSDTLECFGTLHYYDPVDEQWYVHVAYAAPNAAGNMYLWWSRFGIGGDGRLAPAGRTKALHVVSAGAAGRSGAAFSPKSGYLYISGLAGYLSRVSVNSYANAGTGENLEEIAGATLSNTILRVVCDAAGNDYLLYETTTSGHLAMYPYGGSEVELLSDMHTGTDIRKWSAACSTLEGGTEVLLVAYYAATGYWILKVFELDGSLLYTDGCCDSATWTGVCTIGPFLGNTTGGIVLFSDDTALGLYWCTVSEAGVFTWSTEAMSPLYNALEPDWYKIAYNEYCIAISDWSTNGDEPRILVANSAYPAYDRVYLLRLNTQDDSGSSLTWLRVDAAFSYGFCSLNQGTAPYYWRRRTSLSVGDDGSCYCLIAEGVDQRADTLGLYCSEPVTADNGACGLSVKAGHLTLFTGGFLSAFDGNTVFPMGLMQPPWVSAVVASAGTNNWQYCCIVEWRDAGGALHRSAPSAVVSVASAVSSTVSIYGTTLPYNTLGAVTVVYRTVHNGSTFYEVKRRGYGTSTSFTDSMADSTLQSKAILYTQGASGALGGQLAYAPPPGCRSIAVSPTRVCLGGIERPRQVQFSHEFYPGEAPMFSDFDGLRVELPDDVVGVSWNGSQWLVLGTTGLWAITGQGPDVSGSGSFNPPSSVVSPCGAHSPLSIKETHLGTVYQGTDGRIYVVEPGAIQSTEISTPIRDSIATAVAEGDWIRAIVSVDRDGVTTLVFDSTNSRWSYDTVHQLWTTETVSPGRGCVAGGTHYWACSNGSIHYLAQSAAPGTFPAWASAMDVSVDFHRLYPFNRDGYGRLREVTLLLSHADSSYTVTLTDNDDSSSDTLTSEHGTDLDSGDPTAWGRVVWSPRRQKRESLLLSVSGEGEGLWRFHALSLNHDSIPGGARRTNSDGTSTLTAGTPWGDAFSGAFGPS